MKRFLFWFAVSTVLFAVDAHANDYPTRPVKLVVPYNPGGAPDTFARTLSQELAARLGQSVVVENKPGGSLILGTEQVAKAEPDGYTLLLGSASSLASNVGAYKQLPYDPQRDFVPISLVFKMPFYLIVNGKVPATNVQELISLAKSKPGALTFASIGVGSSIHLAGELFRQLAGVDILHVPYGRMNMAADIISGQVNMIFDGGQLLPQVQQGTLRLLAVTSSKRLEQFPDVPTMVEAGVPGYELVSWFCIVAPAGTPAPIVDKLSRTIAEIVNNRDFHARFIALGLDSTSSSPEELGELIKREIPRWSGLLEKAGIAPQ